MIKCKYQWISLRTENSRPMYGQKPRCLHHLMYSTNSQLNFKLVLSFDVLCFPLCFCLQSLSLGAVLETFSNRMDYIASQPITHTSPRTSIDCIRGYQSVTKIENRILNIFVRIGMGECLTGKSNLNAFVKNSGSMEFFVSSDAIRKYSVPLKS